MNQRSSKALIWMVFGLTLVMLVQAAAAQFQNPIKAAKESYEKARQQQQQQQRQQQPPRTSQPPSRNSPASTPTQESATATQSSTEPWTPPTAAAPVGPVTADSIDPVKMPDVVGVHLGMPLNQVGGVLQAAYPGQKVTPSGDRFPGMTGVTTLDLGVDFLGPNAESVFVDVLPPPNAPIVWRVYRKTNPVRQPVGRAAMLAALREKYHKEAFAYTAPVGARVPLAKTDEQIGALVWAFDTEGRNVSMPDGALDREKCDAPVWQDGMASPGFFLDEARSGPLTSASDPRVSRNSWCSTAGIFLSVVLINYNNDPKFISATLTTMVHMPMAVRAEKATTNWWRETVEKLRQEQIQKSNQIKPKL